MDTDTLRALEARTIDGTGNNEANADWGAAGAIEGRIADAMFADGAASLVDGPNPRAVTNAVLAQDGDTVNAAGVNDLFAFFGQFLDHDIGLTPTGDSEPLVVIAPDDDPFYAEGHMFFTNRSLFAEGTGAGADNPREFVNVLTAFVDGSQIYGSDPALTAVLRADGGMGAELLLDDDGNLPTMALLKTLYPEADFNDIGSPITSIGDFVGDGRFVAGDARANENVALTALHTIWAREHNYQVDRLRALEPGWTEDELFAAARVIVEAELQHIVYAEYLPKLIGDALPGYMGYDPLVDPGLSLEFTTAAYRLGHSQVPSVISLLNEDGTPAGTLELFEAFFNPQQLLDTGIEPMILGSAAQGGQELDAQIVDDVRSMLFPPGDLGLLNILRGRDHGLASLNETREALGLDPHESFEALTGDTTVASQLASVYDTVDDVELWVGGLAEADAAGSQLGATLTAILARQFDALRTGDRFYYETRLADQPALLQEIATTSFAEIIARNTEIDALHHDAFLGFTHVMGTEDQDDLTGSDGADLLMGLDGKDMLAGGLGADTLQGGADKDTLFGGAADDWLDGGAGKDKLYGGLGDDTYVVTKGDKLSEKDGGGHDTVRGDETIKLKDDLEDAMLTGMAASNIKGNALDNRLVGNGADNRLYGKDGDDVLIGAGGEDLLNGGKGDDRLDGGAGADELIGGQGSDTFVFGPSTGTDWVKDFDVAEDRLDVSALFEDLESVLASAVETDKGVYLVSDNAGLVLRGLDLDDLAQVEFIF